MRATLSKFEEEIFLEKCLRLFVVESCNKCHGDDLVHIYAEFHLHECNTEQV